MAMRPMTLPAALLTVSVVVGCLGCGVGVSEPPATLTPIEAMVPVVLPDPTPYRTATPWPTFTPEPTPFRYFEISVPTAVPLSTPIPLPTAVIEVRPTPTRVATLPQPEYDRVDVTSILATPTLPIIQYQVPDLDLKLERQTVFMSHYAEPPDFFPPPARIFYTRTARYIGWWVDFDYAEVPADFEMSGLLRVLNVTNGELVMHQEPYQIGHGDGLFLMLGDAVPGKVWFPGLYRFEAWDNRDRVMVYYDFELRSGQLH